MNIGVISTVLALILLFSANPSFSQKSSTKKGKVIPKACHTNIKGVNRYGRSPTAPFVIHFDVNDGWVERSATNPNAGYVTIDDDDGFLTFVTTFLVMRSSISQGAPLTQHQTDLLKESWQLFETTNNQLTGPQKESWDLAQARPEIQELRTILQQDMISSAEDLEKVKRAITLLGSPHENPLVVDYVKQVNSDDEEIRFQTRTTDTSAREYRATLGFEPRGCGGQNQSQTDFAEWCMDIKWRCTTFGERVPIAGGAPLCPANLFNLGYSGYNNGCTSYSYGPLDFATTYYGTRSGVNSGSTVSPNTGRGGNSAE